MNDTERKKFPPRIGRKRLFWIIVILFMLGVPGKEIWQIVTVKIAVDNIAQKVSRYLSSGQYDLGILQTLAVKQHAVELLKQKYNMLRVRQKSTDSVAVEAITPDLLTLIITASQDSNRVIKYSKNNETQQILFAIRESVRYYSALNTVSEIKARLPDPDTLKVITCSDALDYTYSVAEDKCYPYNDIGEDGSLVIVSVSYSYQIGSSIGLNLGTYNFHAFQETVNECSFCFTSFLVKLSGNIPNKYSMTLVDETGASRNIECKQGEFTENPFDGTECLTFGARFWRFSPNLLTVTIEWDTGNYSEVVKPIYVDYPNKRCGEFCKNGIIYIVLP